MATAVAHRGPDGEGFYVDGPLGLAHRRLAVIDLSQGGSQPKLSSCGRFAMSYNGEIYNYRELKIELASKGRRFQSESDSEVVLEALAEWGERALDRFNGMFAISLWDREKRKLLLARDRYGVKPLYYRDAGQCFLFGSEIKAIRAHQHGRSELDAAALLEYFTFQNFFTDATLFRGVRLLPAGSMLWLSSDHASALSSRRYWDFHFHEARIDRPKAAYADELVGLFQQAVKRQMVSDVPVGCYLSGGMDSGSISAVAAKIVPDICTFTIGFDLSSASGIELGYDERKQAEHLSYLMKTEHYEMVLKAGDMERAMSSVVRHIEEPRVGQCYPNYYAAKLACKFATVVLSGAGGDELFGGYPWRYYRAVVNNNFEHYVDKYFAYWQRLVPAESMRDLFGPIWSSVSHVSPRDIFHNVFARHADELSHPEDYINHSLYFEAKTFLHGLLVVEDKLSMAHGVETRVPFLDNDLVDFAMAVPVDFKLGNLGDVIRLNENEPGPKTARYYDRTRDGKLLLREAMRQFVPDEVVDNVKQGFSAPDASWFRGESIDYVRRIIFNKQARLYDLLDRTVVQKFVGEHLEGQENRRLLIWSLLYMEEWLKQTSEETY